MNSPVAGSILAPAGAPASREKVSVLGGRSTSVAVAVNDSSAPSSTLLSPMGASTGASLTAVTVTVTVALS